ncbi:uncharacterized mitochondrial protein AtMg00810-like [Lathyrus oleraceus]|uniref:uncharacterized mitochondrial protein AtMg00810-like n=1 Tax=Pisum sativum TaxID=3888 RepID=UPI0021D0CF8C|nr:uncharacterized mitochondrial protein AtMg00810-like [Pisum sativum]
MAKFEPVNAKKALSDPKWICVIKEGLESIEKNSSWELVDLSKREEVNWCEVDVQSEGSNGECISKFKSELMDEFEMKDIGLMTYFLGIEFHKSEMGLLMHQRRYALEILKKCEIVHCNAAISSAEPRLQLSKNEDEKDVDPTQYRRLIGSLRYLGNTRPDLAFNVGIVSRFMERTKVSYIAAVKRILRYVKGSVGRGILFHAAGRNCILLGFTDSN